MPGSVCQCTPGDRESSRSAEESLIHTGDLRYNNPGYLMRATSIFTTATTTSITTQQQLRTG